MDCNDRITTSIGWSEDSLEQFSKVYPAILAGEFHGFIYRELTGEYAAHLYEDHEFEEGISLSLGEFSDTQIAKKWLDLAYADLRRLYTIEDYEIEKEWMEKVRESS